MADVGRRPVWKEAGSDAAVVAEDQIGPEDLH